MPDYDNSNKGVAFKNDYKKEDKHPDWKGRGNFNGQDFEIAIWERTSPKGQFFSIAFSEPYEKPEQSAPIVGETDKQGNINLSDIPL